MQLKVKITSLILCVVLCICTVCFGIHIYAYEVTDVTLMGIVSTQNTDLNVRKGPGTEYEKVGTVAKGAIIDITGTTTNAEKEEWYKISINGIVGFVMTKYVTLVDVPETPDEAFELSISQFPESYKAQLRKLHAIYPSWKFTPLNTNLSWETLMKNECVIGRNLLQSPEAWMSFEDGAYNFTDKYWYSFDSGNWRQACIEVIAYYLDPRNFLDSNIYQFLVLSDDGSEYDPKVINEILKGTFMYDSACGEIATYGEALVKAGKEAGASPYMLAARIKMEQGANGNKLAHGTVAGYEGYYNHFDIGAYAHSGNSAILNGAIYAANSKRNWNTPYKAILGGAQFLVKNYIAVGQNTLYLQKYDVVDGGNGLYSHQYMTNVSAAVSECATLRNAIINAGATDSPLNFLIPVYSDMPEEYGTLPLKTGNANNLLSALTVEGGKVTENFDKYTFGYDVFTQETQITVKATAMESGAKIEGTGVIELKEGINEIPITVTATNGLKRVYTLYVSSSAEKVFTTNYKTKDNLILDISVGTTLEDFKKEISTEGYTVKYLDAKGNEKATGDIMKTGDKVSLVYNEQEERVLEVVVYGDTNGDGKLSSVDLLKTQKVILALGEFESPVFAEAGDFSKDGKVNSKDLLACQKKILGLE